MKKDYTKLSAYIDDELSAAEMEEIKSLLETDIELADEFAKLGKADELIGEEFDAYLGGDISEDLIAQIENADLEDVKALPVAANSNIPWRSIAASLVMLVLGAAGGYYLNDRTQPNIEVAASENWLTHVASYHGIYAKEKRHLVEVAANESDHIMKWLGNTTNVSFNIPDLAQSGFEFRGARLLVVKSQPVAQLMYTNAEGQVIAICFKQDAGRSMGADGLQQNLINDFNIVSWTDRSANFLVIGDIEQTELKDIADIAKLDI